MQPDRLTPSQEKLRYFKYDHLPQPIRMPSKYCSELAHMIEETVPDGPQKTLGLQKLLEAKDCFVRAALPKEGEAYIGDALRQHAILEHDLRPTSELEGDDLKAWHDRDHEVVKTHEHG